MQSSLMQLQRPVASISNVRVAGRKATLSACRANKLTADRNSIIERPIGGAIARLAAALVSTSSPSAAIAEETNTIYSAGPSQYNYPAAERYSEQQEARFDEYLQTAELRQLLELLQGNPKASDLEQARLKVREHGSRHAYSLHEDIELHGKHDFRSERGCVICMAYAMHLAWN